MTQFFTRTVFVLDVPADVDVLVLKPEQAVLRFREQVTADIGALCYLRRESTEVRSVRKASEGRRVDPSSLCVLRVEHIRSFISYVSNQARYSGYSCLTLHAKCQQFIRFLSWADDNGHSHVLDNFVNARSVAIAYLAHVRERVSARVIKVDFGAVMQRQVVAILGDFLGIENFARGMNLLRKDSNISPTTPPDEAEQAKTLTLCEALFNGLSDLAINGKPYPFGVEMPLHLGYPNNIMWVMPTSSWCMSATKLKEKHVAGVYNYREGKLLSKAEISTASAFWGNRKRGAEILNRTKRHMSEANTNPFHWHRRFMGIMALNAFIPMFLSRTGMNWEQAIGLRWTDDNKSVLATRQRFRSIKARAGGKEIFFQLPLGFMPAFKHFLKLRDWILQDYPDFDRLFFSMGRRSSEPPAPIRTAIQGCCQFICRIDPSCLLITSRAWRAAKSDWLVTRTDISTTAQLLQNSENTVRRHYAAGSFESHMTEVSQFFSQIVLTRKSVGEVEVESAVGTCSSYGSPLEIDETHTLVKPNCENPEVGCIFCDKFKVHVDEKDVRKLLSCRYCLLRTSHLSGFHSISEPLVERIQLILDEIANHNKSLITKIAQEVDEGELDPYWASKYDMLLRLRLVQDVE